MVLNGIIGHFKDEYEFLSNFYMRGIEVEINSIIRTCKSNEHGYQASKSLDDNVVLEILKLETPGQAKRFWKKTSLVSPSDGRTDHVPPCKGRTEERIRPDWFEVNLDIMCRIVRAKFSQHPDLANRLLATYPRELVEKNHWHDNFWGSCTCGKCPPGKNHLGKILMQIRCELFNQS